MNVFRFKDLRVAAERAGRSLCSSPSLDQEVDMIYMCVCVYMCTYMCMYRFLNRETSEISFIFSRRKPRVFPIPFALFFQVFPIPFALFFQVFPIPFTLFFQVFPIPFALFFQVFSIPFALFFQVFPTVPTLH